MTMTSISILFLRPRRLSEPVNSLSLSLSAIRACERFCRYQLSAISSQQNPCEFAAGSWKLAPGRWKRPTHER